MSTDPVRVDLGTRSFSPKSAIAFMFDDGKNGPVIASLAFYESNVSDCETATRALADDGGGVSGLQIETSQLAGTMGSIPLNVMQPIGVEVKDVTTGGVYFAEKYLLRERVFGTVAFTAASFADQGGVVSGFVHVDGHAVRDRASDFLMSGTFQARICKREYW